MLSELTVSRLCAEFGARVKAARKKAKLSPKELAGLVGLSRSSIANLEAGRQRVPIHVVWNLAAALDTPVAELVPGPQDDSLVGGSRVSDVLSQEPRLERVTPASKRRVREFIKTKLAEMAVPPNTEG